MLTKTVCPYCGVGCSLNLETKEGKIIGIKPDNEDSVSEGKPCIKGMTSYQSIYAKDRIKKPMIRKGGRLIETSWEEAYKYIHKKIKKYKNNEIAFYGSSPATNEDLFLLQKFARETFQTENLDSCARLCHATTVYAMNEVFGVKAMTAKYEDFKEADCILIIDSNPAISYPVVFNKIMEAKKKGATIIYIGEHPNETAEQSDIYVEIMPGTQTAILNAILKEVIEKNKVRVSESVKNKVSGYTKLRVAEICKTTPEKIARVAKEVVKSQKFVLSYGMGMTQHTNGASNVFAAANLVIAKNGKIIPMRGKANIQGVGDMGFEPEGRGETILSYVFYNPVKAMYIMESNPAQSLPELNRAHKIMKKMFIVLQTTFPCLTMEYANVVLPSCTWAEREGTFTSAESRIRYLNKAAEPKWGKPNWMIIKELAAHFGKHYNYKNADDIFKDIKKEIKGYEKISLGKVKKGESQFAERKIKYKRYHPAEFEGVEEPTSKEYPYTLTTQRYMHQFCTGEMTERTSLNKISPEAHCLVSKEDAIKLKIKDGQEIELKSRVGKVRIKAKISYKIPEKLLVAPYHFKQTLINKLVPLDYGPIVEEPNLKKIAVRIRVP
ncbi:MAG: molybdopterin-dependent oxidoreductase [Candidatus Nanoarchaeia archaeon]